MIIITEKPMRSVEVNGWYIDEYTDKSNKKIYKVVGIVSPKRRGRIVTRDTSVVKDVYMDEETVTIYRSENRNNVLSCKRIMDLMASRGSQVFALDMFYDWLSHQPTDAEEVNANED